MCPPLLKRLLKRHLYEICDCLTDVVTQEWFSESKAAVDKTKWSEDYLVNMHRHNKR